MSEPVAWAPGLSVLSDVGAARWVQAALSSTGRSYTVEALVPAVFPGYARVLPPTYPDGDDERRVRWSAIAAEQGVSLSAGTGFRDLVAGSERWGRPADGGLDVVETAALVRVLTAFTGTPDEAYFCVWDGFGVPETEAWRDRPARVRVPDREYHLLTGPVSAAVVLPDSVQWRCANLWWPADRSWLVATEIDGYLTYVGGSTDAVAALLAEPALVVVRVQPSTPLDPSYG